jgi:hypothetical protein
MNEAIMKGIKTATSNRVRIKDFTQVYLI